MQEPEIPDSGPPAPEHRGQKAAESEAGDERQPPSSCQAHGVTREVADGQHEAADILEARRDAEPTVREEEQREGDQRDTRARAWPMDRREDVQDQRHNSVNSQLPAANSQHRTLSSWQLAVGEWKLLS